MTRRATVSGNSVKVAWVVPARNTDGSTLAAGHVAGYRVYARRWGARAGKLAAAVAGCMAVVALAKGTWFLAVSCVDRAGDEGPRTNEVRIKVGR